MADFNETRPSDIYVVNFGAHYHEDPGGEDLFRSEVSLLLDDIAEIADSATVVWRWAFAHFSAPGVDKFHLIRSRGPRVARVKQ